jgi:hypothetical protein
MLLLAADFPRSFRGLAAFRRQVSARFPPGFRPGAALLPDLEAGPAFPAPKPVGYLINRLIK